MAYRRNVAAFVLNQDSKILMCERSDYAGTWQLPQGGVHEGESLVQALARELDEEIGVKKFDIIAQLPSAIRYDWPPTAHKEGYIGQEQWYFLVRLAENETIDVSSNTEHIEFQSYEWLGMQEFLSRLSGFKANAYRQALAEFSILMPNLIQP